MSSSDIAISVKGLGKSYQIDHERRSQPTFRDTVMRRLRNPFARHSYETFWALKDIDLEIQKGDVVGIIGRNGAGKSTLLKILSRITEPTTGRVDLFGRIGSLLEVGTGFHPELTGRENIFLNGSVLGMRRKEIQRQFDAIVDFAEVEKFLDTPVKHYSSGMYVRLAFAVAAHLNPEILVVDEVLAVGDAQFQKKCLGKMSDVARSGRTVLLVSHNTAAIANLCGSCVVLNRGTVFFAGETSTGIQHYVSLGQTLRESDTDLSAHRPSWAKPIIQAVRTVAADGTPSSQFMMGSDVNVEMDFDTLDRDPLNSPVMGVVVNHATLGPIGGVNMRMTKSERFDGPYRAGTIACRLRGMPLLPGSYAIDVWLGDGAGDVDTVAGVTNFEMELADVYGSGVSPFKSLGSIFLRAEWDVRKRDAAEAAQLSEPRSLGAGATPALNSR